MATKEMVLYCFHVIDGHLNDENRIEDHLKYFPFDTNKKFPLFVTWEIKETKNLNLRGCIGTLSPVFLSELGNYAMLSAFSDQRFKPISKYELSKLYCSVSILIHYESTSNYMDWTIGLHGISIEYECNKSLKKKKYKATYLPEVIINQGWNHEEAIYSLLRKAGYQSNISITVLENTRVMRYQSSKIKMSYNQYLIQRKKLQIE